MKFAITILLASMMMTQSTTIIPVDTKTTQKSRQFFQSEPKATILCYWYYPTPVVDSARTAWIGVDGFAMNEIDHVLFLVENRGVVKVEQKTLLKMRNAPAYWIGVHGSRTYASEKYGNPVINLIEINYGETIHIQAVVVDKNGKKAFSTKPIKIKWYGSDSINPFLYSF